MQIYLLKDYQQSKKGDTINVSNNIAHGLIESGIARIQGVKDSLQKTEFGETKSFGKAPQKGGFQHKKNS